MDRPTTPQHDATSTRKLQAIKLDVFIASLSQRFGFQLDSKLRSPSKRSNENACVNVLCEVWWSKAANALEKLNECVENFAKLDKTEQTLSRLREDLHAVAILLRHSSAPQKRRNSSTNDKTNTLHDTLARSDIEASDTIQFDESVPTLPSLFPSHHEHAGDAFISKTNAERPSKRLAVAEAVPKTTVRSQSFSDSISNERHDTPSASFDTIFSKPDQTKSADTSFTEASLIESGGQHEQSLFEDEFFSSSPLSSTPPHSTCLDIRLNDLSGFHEPESIPKHPRESVDAESRTSAENFRIRDLPQQGFFGDAFPRSNVDLPWFVRYEFERFIRHFKRPLPLLNPHVFDPTTLSNYNDLRKTLQQMFASPHDHCPPRTSLACWTAASRSSNSVCLSGRIQITQNVHDQSLFRLQVQPLKMETGSRRFFRKFGSYRFLSVLFPALNRLPPFITSQRGFLLQRLQEWLNVPDKQFMGCKWTAIFTRAIKDRKRSRADDESDYYGGYEIIFFATQGFQLSTVTVDDVCNWFLPLKRNENRFSCKTFARLELGFSKTQATLVFLPSQLRWKKDMHATSITETNEFDDTEFPRPNGSATGAKVMNDGCSLISFAAAKLIWPLLGGNGPIPSAFQARIGPAKGMWIISHPADLDSSTVWIEITESQTKFDMHLEDELDQTYDPERWTFEVIQWSRTPSTSTLYLDYLPILQDRGVPIHSVKQFVLDSLQEARVEVENALRDSPSLLKWLQDTRTFTTDVDSTFLDSRGMRGKLRGDKIRMLLESGFDLESCRYLVDTVVSAVAEHVTRIARSLNTPIHRSRSAFGVADPLRCLAPHEVHFGSSEPFIESRYGSGIPSMFLDGELALLARHPALRRSDIQKVRVVYKPQLRHLVNVIVFPTQGAFPLAGKLQGGDYDGDNFWICWEPAIVQSFRNAPAPSQDPRPESYGIKVDRTTVGQVLSTSQTSTRGFLKHNFALQWQPRLLGTITVYHEKLKYTENTIHSPALNAIADIHDLLVDSAKNGYMFNDSDWSKFRQGHNDLTTREAKYPQTPAYKETARFDTLDGKSESKYKISNIIDFLIFRVARPKAQQIAQDIERKLHEQINDCEPALQTLYFNKLKVQDREIKECLKQLAIDLKSLHDEEWSSVHEKANHPDVSRKALYDDAHEAIRKRFKAIFPNEAFRSNPTIQAWLDQPAEFMPTTWELIKASTLFAQYNKLPNFVFSAAIELLCHLKAYSVGKAIPITPKVFCNMKFKKLHNKTLDTAEKAAQEERGEIDSQLDDEGETTEEDVDPNEGQDIGMHEAEKFYDAPQDFQEMEIMMSSSLIV